MRGRPTENVTRKLKYKLEFEDSIWHYDENKFPMNNISVNPRKIVRLVKSKAIKTILLNKDLKFIDLYLKNKNGTFIGLSSGAGSALMRINGKVFKIKRCGLNSGGIYPDLLFL